MSVATAVEKKKCPACGCVMSTLEETQSVQKKIEPYCANFACAECWVHKREKQ